MKPFNQKSIYDQNQPWLSSELDHKIKHMDEIRQLFIEDLTNQMSSLIVQTDRGREASPEKNHEEKIEDPLSAEESDENDDDQVLLDLPDETFIPETKEMVEL